MSRSPTADRRKFRMRDGSSGQLLALEQHALDVDFDVPEETPETEASNGIAVLEVSGPLEHHGGWFWDSYDAITERAEQAFSDPSVKAVVMRIDSPGGDANGMIEASRKLRALAENAGKKLYAYSDESCYSAAYGLAVAADEIWLPETGGVGSVGVIATVLDRTKANDKAGVVVELITTGARKADTHPDRPLTKDVRSNLQARVDYLGGVFASHVGARRGMASKAVLALEAGTFAGKAAVDAGLADGVASWDAFLATVLASFGSPENGPQDGPKEETMAGKLLALIQAREAAKSNMLAAKTDDERKKLLAAYEAAVAALAKAESDKDEEKCEDDDEDEKKSESEESEDAEEGEDDEESAEESEDDEKSKSDVPADDEKKSKAILEAPTGHMTYARLFRLCQQVTGVRDVREVFGALDAMGARLKAAAKLEARVGKIENDAKRAKVDGMLSAAHREGRISKAQLGALREQGMRDPKWLKGFLAGSPKIVKTLDDASSPADAREGELSVSAQLTPDQMKIAQRAALESGRPVDDVAKELLERARARMKTTSSTASTVGRF